MSIQQNETTSDLVAYQKIKGAILGGYFKAGERLLEQQLAEKLGISRTPVRQALQMLQKEGFLEKYPHKGVAVRKFDLKQAENIYQIRIVLEALVAYLLAQSAGEDLISQLKQNLFEARQALAEQNLVKVAECNDEFHRLCANNCGNSMLAEMVQNLAGFVSILRVSTWNMPERPSQTIAEHEAMLEAIIKREPEDARALALKHTENSWKATLSMLKLSVVEL